MSIKKRIKPGKIEPSSDGTAIVVHFTTEITYLNEDGEPENVEKVPESRELPVADAIRGIRAEEIPSLAQKVVDKCRYIPASKTRHVEQVLIALCAAQSTAFGAVGDTSSERSRHGSAGVAPGHSNGSGRWFPASSTNGSSAPPSGTRPADLLPWASAEHIDDCVEALYEDTMDAKADGARRLLRLSTEVDLLEEISEHSSLLGVLSRELRDNAKRSHQLAVAISGIFLCLAHFSQFHPALGRHQCGEATMKVVEYESRRRDMLHKELKLHQGQMVARGSALSGDERRKQEQEERRYRILFVRQDRLLLLCLLIVRNMAEDPAIECMLVKQRLVHFVLHHLMRGGEELLLVTLGLLHRLCRVEHNKDQIVSNSDALCYLADLAGHQQPEVSLMALRICYNLCFDARGRSALSTQTSLLGKLLSLCQQGHSKKVAFKVLYQLSTEPQLRPSIASSCPGCISLALHMSAKSRDHRADLESLALCINFAADEACATVLVKSDGFQKVVMRGIQGADALVLKVVRHVASHASLRRRLLSVLRNAGSEQDGWLSELVRLASAASERPEICVEAIGVLAALECPGSEVPWARLCVNGLMELLHRVLIVGFSDDDILLECVILVGTLALDPECVPILAASKVPRLLADLIGEKQDDGDLMVQILYAVQCLLLQPETREAVRGTDIMELILEMLQDSLGKAVDREAQAISAAADEVLELILAVEGDMGGSDLVKQIKAYRFEAFNFEWCQRIRRGDHQQDRLEPGLSKTHSGSDRRGACRGEDRLEPSLGKTHSGSDRRGHHGGGFDPGRSNRHRSR